MKAWWLPELVRFWNLVYGRYGLQPRKVAFTVLLCFMKGNVPTVGETDTCAREDESDSIWPGLLPLIRQFTLAKHSCCLGKLPTWCSTPPRGCRWQATRDSMCGTPEVFTALLCHFSLKEDKFFFLSLTLTTNMYKLYIHTDKSWKELQMRNIWFIRLAEFGVKFSYFDFIYVLPCSKSIWDGL